MSLIQKRLLKRALKVIHDNTPEYPSARKLLKYNIRDLTFMGDENLFVEGSEYHKSDGQALDPRVIVPKKLVKHLPQIMGLPTNYFKIVGLPELTHPVCKILQAMKVQQMERRKASADQIEALLAEARAQGVDGITSHFDADHVIDFTEWLFDFATILAEQDPYYRTWMFDILINAWQNGEKSRMQQDPHCARCTKGGRVGGHSSWIDNLLEEMNNVTMDMMQNYMNMQDGGEDMRITGIDEETRRIKLEKGEKAKA